MTHIQKLYTYVFGISRNERIILKITHNKKEKNVLFQEGTLHTDFQRACSYHRIVVV